MVSRRQTTNRLALNRLKIEPSHICDVGVFVCMCKIVPNTVNYKRNKCVVYKDLFNKRKGHQQEIELLKKSIQPGPKTDWKAEIGSSSGDQRCSNRELTSVWTGILNFITNWTIVIDSF